MLGAQLMSHTGSHTGVITPESLMSSHVLTPGGTISDQREAPHQLAGVGILQSWAGFTCWLYIKPPPTLWHRFSWERAKMMQLSLADCRSGFFSSSSPSVHTQTLTGKLCSVSWHLQVQPDIQDILNEKNHCFSFELTLCPFFGILRALPHFSLTIHVHINATEKGVHCRSSHLTTNVQIVPETYKVVYTACPRLHLYFCMVLLSWMLQKLQLTVYMINL